VAETPAKAESFSRKALLVGLLTLPVFLALGYFGMLSMAPEASSGELGPVILDVEGEGFRYGDVVWVSREAGYDPRAVVLFEWRKVNPRGMGPRFTLKRFGDLPAAHHPHVHARICCKLARLSLFDHFAQYNLIFSGRIER